MSARPESGAAKCSNIPKPLSLGHASMRPSEKRIHYPLREQDSVSLQFDDDRNRKAIG